MRDIRKHYPLVELNEFDEGLLKEKDKNEIYDDLHALAERPNRAASEKPKKPDFLRQLIGEDDDMDQC